MTPSEQDNPEAAPPLKQLWKQIVIVVLAAALPVSVVLVLWWSPSTEPEGPIDSIAVLPFVNVGEDPSAEYLCDGIPGTISSSLSQLSGLRIMPSSALKRYQGQEVHPQTVSQELDVRAVMTGTVLLRGETLAVRVELVDGLENRLLWGEQYTREFSDIFKLQEQIAQQIAEALRLQLTPEEHERLTRRGTSNPKAYASYVKGQVHAERLDPAKAIPYFEQAIKEDPSYALAFVALAKSHQRLGYYLTSGEHYQRAREPAERALEIDPELAEAHLMMAEILAFHDRNWAGAERAWNRASDLNPRLTSYWLPDLLLWTGRRDEASAATQRFEEQGDPLSAEHHHLMAFRYYYARKFDLALEKARRAKEIDPEDFIEYLVVWIYEAKGREDTAFEIFLSGPRAEDEEVYRQVFKESGMQGVRRKAFDLGDDPKDAERSKPYDLAAHFALTGEKDLAFEWLNKAFELPVFVCFFTDPRFDSLRDDPRFEQLLRKLNLPEDAIQRHLAVPDGTP